ncbi:MAG: thiamine phosphate synthase [Chitinophagales bacterium]
MKISVMTNPYDLMNETTIINRLFEEGLEELHLRKPAMDKRSYRDFILAIHPKYHRRIVIHAHFGLIREFELKGIHVEEEMLTNRFFNWILRTFMLGGKEVKKYVTVHSLSRVGKVANEADEVLIGPIFRKVSQVTCNRMYNVEAVEKTVKKYHQKLAGIGSVCSQTIVAYLQFGFESVTTQTAIWKSSDPIASYIELRQMASQSGMRAAA